MTSVRPFCFGPLIILTYTYMYIKLKAFLLQTPNVRVSSSQQNEHQDGTNGAADV